MNSAMLVEREKDYRARIAEYREKLLSSEVKKFINECDTATGNSLLHQSVMKKYYSFIPYLVKEGAHVNIRNKKGYTGKTLSYYPLSGYHLLCFLNGLALHMAAEMGDILLLDILVRNNADPTARTNDDETAWKIAMKMGHFLFAERLKILVRPYLVSALFALFFRLIRPFLSSSSAPPARKWQSSIPTQSIVNLGNMIFSPESSIADYNDDFHSLTISDKIIFAKHFHNYFPEKVLEHAMEVLTPTELMEIEHKVSPLSPSFPPIPCD
jgi:hypothetical protein